MIGEPGNVLEREPREPRYQGSVVAAEQRGLTGWDSAPPMTLARLAIETDPAGPTLMLPLLYSATAMIAPLLSNTVPKTRPSMTTDGLKNVYGAGQVYLIERNVAIANGIRLRGRCGKRYEQCDGTPKAE